MHNDVWVYTTRDTTYYARFMRGGSERTMHALLEAGGPDGGLRRFVNKRAPLLGVIPSRYVSNGSF